jgi:hypothetical protein
MGATVHVEWLSCRSECCQSWTASLRVVLRGYDHLQREGKSSARRQIHGEFMWDCKVETPAKLVVVPEGLDLQKRVWNELREILEEIEPGLASNF